MSVRGRALPRSARVCLSGLSLTAPYPVSRWPSRAMSVGWAGSRGDIRLHRRPVRQIGPRPHPCSWCGRMVDWNGASHDRLDAGHSQPGQGGQRPDNAHERRRDRSCACRPPCQPPIEAMTAQVAHGRRVRRRFRRQGGQLMRAPPTTAEHVKVKDSGHRLTLGTRRTSNGQILLTIDKRPPCSSNMGSRALTTIGCEAP